MGYTIDADAARLAGLQIDTLQKLRQGQLTLKHLEGFNNLTKEERDQLFGGVIDDRFVVLKTCKLTVPEHYNHATQLAEFQEQRSPAFVCYDKNITDEHFSRATQELIPGKTYALLKFIGIKSRATSEDCLAVQKSQRAILVGAQGLSLAWEEKKDEFPVGKRTLSFDEKEALWADSDGYHRVPAIGRSSGGGWFFGIGHFAIDWDDNYCFLCLCDS